MKAKAYCTVSSLLFAAVAVGHGVRAARNLPLTIGAYSAPVWGSWLAVAVAGLLALWGLSLALGRQ